MRVTRNWAALWLLLGAPAVFGAPNNSEDGWFEIEIIVFEYRPQAAESSETWPVDPGAPDVMNAIELAPAPLPATFPGAVEGIPAATVPGIPAATVPGIPAATVPGIPAATVQGISVPQGPTPGLSQAAIAPGPLLTPFQQLAESETKLGTLYNKLVLAEEYVPLLHVAWRQPLMERDHAQPVHIAGARPRAAESDLWGAGNGLAAPPSDPLLAERFGTIEGAGGGDAVDGTITVSRNRYLHLDADLVYHRRSMPPGDLSIFSIFGPREEEAGSFRLRQSRRMRPGELHYFDHPRFGVLAQVTPFESPGKQPPGVEVIPLGRPSPP